MAASHIQKIQNVKALMIQITRKEACCGCEACVQICPKACISLKEDEEGFWYPHVDVSKCVDCRLCEQVCPVLHQEEPARPLHIYAAKNKNEEIRLDSSSGGIFTLLAEDVLRRGGVVFWGAGLSPSRGRNAPAGRTWVRSGPAWSWPGRPGA